MRTGRTLASLACLSLLGALAPSVAAALPARFTDTAAIEGLKLPTSVDFSSDGRVFVAEKSGLIKVFDDLSDGTPTLFADLRTETYNGGNSGLLGLALDPEFPTRPYVYVSYAYDAEIGGTAPRWGTAGQTSDPCPAPPGPTADGCVASGRLSRLTADGNTMISESVLINDWCQQFWDHSIGDIAFGADGSLYMSGGDGAAISFTDYGQRGIPLNPCGDPPSGIGGVQTAPTSEGGALRSQDYRTTGDPLGLSGSLIRVDPDTGRPIPDLPGELDQSVLNEQRVVAYGFRNPFRDRSSSWDERGLGRRRGLEQLGGDQSGRARDHRRLRLALLRGLEPATPGLPQPRPQHLQRPLHRRRSRPAVFQLRAWQEGDTERDLRDRGKFRDQRGRVL